MFPKAVPTPGVIHSVGFPFLYFTQDILFLVDSMQYFLIFHRIHPTDLLQPSLAPRVKI